MPKIYLFINFSDKNKNNKILIYDIYKLIHNIHFISLYTFIITIDQYKL